MAVLPTPDPPNLLVPPDHRIQLSAPGLIGEVPGEPLQRLVLPFRSLVGHPMGAAHRLQGRPQVGGGQAEPAQQLPGGAPLLLHQRNEQMLGGYVRVTQVLGLFFGTVEHPVELAAVAGRPFSALLARELGDLAFRGLPERRDVESGLLKQGLDDALVLVEQRQEEVGVVDHRVAPGGGQLGRVSEGLLGLECQSVGPDHRASPDACKRTPFRGRLKRSRGKVSRCKSDVRGGNWRTPKMRHFGLGEDPRIGDASGDSGAVGPLQEGDEELAGEGESLPQHWRSNWRNGSKFSDCISKEIQGFY
jgi:hypothetical protein